MAKRKTPKPKPYDVRHDNGFAEVAIPIRSMLGPAFVKCETTKEPSGYIAWHDWAERMSKTHRQIRCPTCCLFTIWNRKAEPPHA